jgi:dual specificity tyrosine-phosphorylation-regulated kinase 2/3/4
MVSQSLLQCVSSCSQFRSLKAQQLDGQDSPTEHIAGKARILRSSRSVASDIGGDEVLYPRRTGVVEPAVMDAIPDMPQHFPEEGQVLQIDSFEIASAAIPKELSSAENPPSPIKFGAIERDDIGTSGTTRKHRSLILPQVSANTKERRKTDLHSGRAKSFTREEHTRRASASSSSSSLEAGVAASSRRHHADYSHLPPSPSSSSIQHLLRSPPTPNSGARIKPASSPSAAAHSLLRGMQEGWSGLDDHATVEVLRKLDGVSGKSMKPRLSIGLLGTKTNSRPGTPGAKGASTNEQWEGIGSDGARAVPQRRGSSSSMKGLSSAEEVIPSTSNTPARKSSLSTNSTRSSFAKRSSAMSTAPSSVLSNESATQLTQPYVKTVRTGRSSAGSDVSGAHPDFDRIPSSTVVPTEETEVPPVPPLPKEIATATRQHGHSPELVTHDAAPSVPASPRTTEHILKHEDLQQSSLLEVRPVPVSAARSDDAISSLSSHRPRNEQPVKTPVKKWSFSSALSLRLGNSPSSTELRSAHRSSSPRQTQTRMPPTISMDSNNSALRDIDLGGSSVSLPMAANIASAPVSESARTSDSPIRGEGLFSMGNTSHSVAPPLSPASRRVSSSKRLTPSSIPFFRRSSSQAMHEIARSEEEYSPSSLPNSSDALRSPLASTDDVSLPSASQGSSKKASAFGMGLPSLLKGSVSRRSLQSEHDSTNDKSYSTRADARKSDEDAALRQLQKQERHKLKKDKSDKDRSESRISILMGRRRGKVGQSKVWSIC